MDISMDIHIHGNPDYVLSVYRQITLVLYF